MELWVEGGEVPRAWQARGAGSWSQVAACGRREGLDSEMGLTGVG